MSYLADSARCHKIVICGKDNQCRFPVTGVDYLYWLIQPHYVWEIRGRTKSRTGKYRTFVVVRDGEGTGWAHVGSIQGGPTK